MKPTLTRAQKVFLVTRLACYERTEAVKAEFDTVFGTDIDRRQVFRHDLSRPYNQDVNKDLRNLFWKTREAFDAHLMSQPLATKIGRVRKKILRHEALERIADARALLADAAVPGSKEGYLDRGSVDKALLDALDKIEESIAEELGQRVKNIRIADMNDDQLLRAIAAAEAAQGGG